MEDEGAQQSRVSSKQEGAFLTISELAGELGIPQHILRYWETRFSQLRPLQRAGNRRYYRPADVQLAKRIHGWLERDGYTIKGVQRLLAGKSAEPEVVVTTPAPQLARGAADVAALRRIRDKLAAALEGDAA